jgi:probable rRNA maturation factor
LSQRAIAVANLHPRLRFDRRAVVRAIRALDSRPAAPARGQVEKLDLRGGGQVFQPDPFNRPAPGEISVVFLTDAALAALHGRFLGDPAPTDVITFPPSGRGLSGIAGEICVSADAAARQIRPSAGRKGDVSSELTFYLVHGWLHLAGHDDLEPAKKRAMRRAEARAMRFLRDKGLVPRFAFDRPEKGSGCKK